MCATQLKRMVALFLSVLCLACATSAPAPAPDPTVRQSIRQLNKGVGYYTKGCYAAALRQFNESYEWYTAADHLPGMAQSLFGIANAYVHLDDMQSAILAYDEAIAMYRFLQDHEGLVNALTGKAAALIEARRWQPANDLLQQADALAEKKNLLKALRLKTRAVLLYRRNQLQQAEILLEQALNLADPRDDSLKAGIHYVFGQVLLARHRPDAARGHFESALSIDRNRGAGFHMAQDLNALGLCADQLGEIEAAVMFFKRGVMIFALLQNPAQAEKTMNHLQNSADKARIDTTATRHWVSQWLAGHAQAYVCP
jgi:tetratricopeptide (TPR) repeat protein